MEKTLIFAGEEIDINNVLYFRKCFDNKKSYVQLATKGSIRFEIHENSKVDRRINEIVSLGHFCFFGGHFVAKEYITHIAFLPNAPLSRPILSIAIHETDFILYEYFDWKEKAKARQKEIINILEFTKKGFLFDQDYIIKKFVDSYQLEANKCVRVYMNGYTFCSKHYFESDAQKELASLKKILG
ncbi:MAG: hypothetical protein ACOYMB_04135 [Patescibacteria group bacterium]